MTGSRMSYLVDSDWAVHYLRGSTAHVRRLDTLMTDGVGLSVVSLAELYEGVFRSNDQPASERQLELFVSQVSLYPLDSITCRIFGEQRSRLRETGALIGDLDILIGATALRHGFTLLTDNRRHFERIERLRTESIAAGNS